MLAYVPEAWDSGGRVELWTSTPLTRLAKVELQNTGTDGHNDCGFIRERGKGTRGREDH